MREAPPASRDGAPIDGALLRMTGITKRYGGVRALEDASFSCDRGRIHAILGENGAGKSTLIKIMAGVTRPDAGEILLDGRRQRFAGPWEASDAGIVCIFQELSLMPDLSVADNICIAAPPRRFGLIDAGRQRRIAEAALARIGADDIHPRARVADLSLSRRQIVEIAKALSRNPSVLILDEATSALTAADVDKVLGILARLRTEGMAIVYISHRMNEIRSLADDCTVFRNGRTVGQFENGTRRDEEVVEMMIGREYRHVFPPKPDAPIATDAPPALEVRDLAWDGRLNGITLSLGKGEIVGLGGLDGQGQRELLLALFGVLIGVTGTIRIDGRAVTPGSPQAAKDPAIGMAMIPEDRKTEGLMLAMSVRENLTVAALDSVSRAGIVDRRLESERIGGMIDVLKIKVGSVDQPVGSLSGGNQQKVVIAKWLMTSPRIILLNDPTRGIDVGTKQEIYQLLRRLAAGGASILFYSTDYDELIGCCDRVAVLYNGAITRVLSGTEITERALVASALNLPLDARSGQAA
ncbi:MAG: sugar ABC transporter ATP-binding protein [Lautropia sp.]